MKQEYQETVVRKRKKNKIISNKAIIKCLNNSQLVFNDVSTARLDNTRNIV
jgi:hypothetical protein